MHDNVVLSVQENSKMHFFIHPNVTLVEVFFCNLQLKLRKQGSLLFLSFCSCCLYKAELLLLLPLFPVYFVYCTGWRVIYFSPLSRFSAAN